LNVDKRGKDKRHKQDLNMSQKFHMVNSLNITQISRRRLLCIYFFSIMLDINKKFYLVLNSTNPFIKNIHTKFLNMNYFKNYFN